MNFDLLKQKLLNAWQGLQGQQQASQDWRQNVGQLQQKLQPTIPNPQMPQGQGVLQNLAASIPTAPQMDQNAHDMYRKLLSFFGK